MKKGIFRYFLLLSFCLFVTLKGNAQTQIDQTLVEQNTVWNLAGSPYILSENLTVTPSASLTIEAGVEVFVPANRYIQIEGSLLVTGEQFSPVVFQRADPASRWESIRIMRDATALISGAVIKGGNHCVESYSDNAVITNNHISRCNNGVYIRNGNGTVRNNIIVYNENVV